MPLCLGTEDTETFSAFLRASVAKKGNVWISR